ncbi:glutathione S-transferase domain-containing protein [Planoprotostelium fungivorum]|uniref:Glutathione S-transferase domain-containing protein n=1 Tax=Planoprotostelium fungivorum TaxID=1890364 RepID=A0A2P6N7Z5_9EUKA|nr:glutathione S-transferase domain-containing protein [Planoprotostelium fungivorum]
MSLKLHTADKTSPATFKVLVAAQYAGVKVDVVETETAPKGESIGKLPILETPQGLLSGSDAAAHYIIGQGKSTLNGSNAFEAAQVSQWVDYVASEIDLPASVWVFPILGLVHNVQPATDKATADIRKVLDTLNKYFTFRTFLVGQRVSYADIAVAASLYQLFQKLFEPAFIKPYGHAKRWFLTIVNQPQFKAVAGEFTICEKKESPREPVKKEAPKKEAAPAKKPAAKKDDDDEEKEENFEDDEPKKKNPLDFLPPSKFNLEEWKRVYSNTDTRKEAIPWFWQNYDPQGFSLWYGEYKYNDELNSTFKTANLLGGYIQRLDKLRKYGFASLVIFGDEPKLEVAGIVLNRGTAQAPELIECDDSEHYNWRQINIEDPKDKELVQDFWAWDGEFGGKKFNQAKNFR